MENFVNKDILDQVDLIISSIKNSDTYKYFVEVSEKLEKNDKAISMIKEVKKLQKQVVKLEIEKKDTSLMDEKISKLIAELDRIPLYNEYVNLQKELDDIFQMIKNKLDDYFLDKLN